MASPDGARVPCPLCGGERFRPVAEVTRYERSFRMVRCAACGLLHRSPRPSDAELAALYDHDYYAGVGDYTYVDERKQEAQVRVRASGRLARVERMLAAEGIATRRVVELGCSWGTFLDEARLRGWEARGCEISPESGGWAREHRSLDVHPCDLADAGLPATSADLVTGSEVVEHLADPLRTLRAALEVLRPRGVAVFSTANENSVARRMRGADWGYFMPGHVVVWSAATLTDALRRAGFEEIEVTAGDERGLANFLAFRRAAGGGSLPGWFLKRIRLGGLTIGAGMVVTARRPGGGA